MRRVPSNRTAVYVTLFCAAISFCNPGFAFAIGLYIATELGDLPGGPNISRGFDINSYGQVIGKSNAETGPRPFIWTPHTRNGVAGTITPLNGLSGGSEFAEGVAINDYGQVAGSSSAETGTRATLWTPHGPNGTTGTVTDLGELTGDQDASYGYGINSYGQVVGTSDALNSGRAFIWTPDSPNGTTGSIAALGDLPGEPDASMASDINSLGQVVGQGSASYFDQHAFVWNPTVANGASGAMVAIEYPPQDTGATGINAFGQVVGSIPAGSWAFVWTPTSPNGTTGSLITLTDQRERRTAAADINSQGQVVGSLFPAFSDIPNVTRAFLWTPAEPNGMTGVMVDLNDVLVPDGSTWFLQNAWAINDHGQIVGTGWYDPDGRGPALGAERAFLLTPVPEPTSAWLAMFVVLWLPCRIRRK